MTEIEQLRNTIAAWEQVPDLIVAMMSPNEHERFTQIYEHSQKRLAKLEAEAAAAADPWAEAIDKIEHAERIEARFPGTVIYMPVIRYVRHLESKAAELETKLETRSGGPGAIANVKDLAAAQARIAELEAKLAKRPVTWQLRDRKSGEVRLVGDFGRKYAAIYSDAEIEYLKTLNGWVAFTNDYAIEPYTGEQS